MPTGTTSAKAPGTPSNAHVTTPNSTPTQSFNTPKAPPGRVVSRHVVRGASRTTYVSAWHKEAEVRKQTGGEGCG
jgi:hypothetical protein